MRQLQERALSSALVYGVLSRLGFLLWHSGCVDALFSVKDSKSARSRNSTTTLQDFSQVLRLCFLAGQSLSILQFPSRLWLLCCLSKTLGSPVPPNIKTARPFIMFSVSASWLVVVS